MQTCLITIDESPYDVSSDSISCIDPLSDTVPLVHSQSPSFAEVSKIEARNPKEKSKKASKLTIRDGQKRQKPATISPILSSSPEPEPKRAKNDNGPSKKETFIKNYHCEMTEIKARMDKILCAPVDMYEMYQTLRASSSSKIPCPTPLLLPPESTASEEITKKRCSIDDRRKALISLFSLRSTLKVCAETLHLAAGILDQCLEKMLVDKKALKDLSAVALVIASKVEEVNCLQLKKILETDLVEECLEQEDPKKMINNLERMVLNTLQFEVTFPTPLTFANYLLVFIHATPSTINLVHYLLELSVLYIHNRMYPSDVIGHAATCLGFAIGKEKTVTSPSSEIALLEAECLLQNFSGIEVADKTSREVMRIIADLFLVAPAEKNDIFNEYSFFRRHAVALRRIDSALQKTLKMD